MDTLASQDLCRKNSLGAPTRVDVYRHLPENVLPPGDLSIRSSSESVNSDEFEVMPTFDDTASLDKASSPRGSSLVFPRSVFVSMVMMSAAECDSQ